MQSPSDTEKNRAQSAADAYVRPSPWGRMPQATFALGPLPKAPPRPAATPTRLPERPVLPPPRQQILTGSVIPTPSRRPAPPPAPEPSETSFSSEPVATAEPAAAPLAAIPSVTAETVIPEPAVVADNLVSQPADPAPAYDEAPAFAPSLAMTRSRPKASKPAANRMLVAGGAVAVLAAAGAGGFWLLRPKPPALLPAIPAPIAPQLAAPTANLNPATAPAPITTPITAPPPTTTVSAPSAGRIGSSSRPERLRASLRPAQKAPAPLQGPIDAASDMPPAVATTAPIHEQLANVGVTSPSLSLKPAMPGPNTEPPGTSPAVPSAPPAPKVNHPPADPNAPITLRDPD